MPVFLRVREGEDFVDVAVLTGAPLTIGRALDVEVSRPGDIRMSSRHARIDLISRICHVRDLGSTNGTFLNGEQIAECQMNMGDVLCCGSTEFTIELTDADRKPQLAAPESPAVKSVGTPAGSTQRVSKAGSAAAALLPPEMQQTTGFIGSKALDVFERFALASVLPIPPQAEESTQEFAKRLLNAGEDNECLIFLAYALPKRMGVWWLTRCIRAAESLKAEGDSAMLEAAEAWVKSPSDNSRRKAMSLAEGLEMGTPASWAGVGAFWSHGSMAPENAPSVPAADTLAGKAISGGAILATVVRNPEKAPERRQQFLDLALKVSAGELNWA